MTFSDGQLFAAQVALDLAYNEQCTCVLSEILTLNIQTVQLK